MRRSKSSIARSLTALMVSSFTLRGHWPLCGDHLPDLLFFLLRFAQRFDIDLDDALAAKMKLNAERYPVEKSRGKNLKYGDL